MFGRGEEFFHGSDEGGYYEEEEGEINQPMTHLTVRKWIAETRHQ